MSGLLIRNHILLYLDVHNIFYRFNMLLLRCVIYNTIILSYDFKMRQDYLSTSYLDQKYLPSERSETTET